MNKLNFMYNGKNVLGIARDLTDAGLAEVALKIAETHPDVFAQAVVGDVKAAEIALTGFGNINITHGQLEFLRSLGVSDKVRAVKYFREEFNLGLKEAKFLTEDLARQGYVKHKSWIPESSFLGDLLKQELQDNEPKNLYDHYRKDLGLY
jgi:2-polyprenyl-6-methoxyphenol hydroxylase-like FAD-dependent oxidoreductase